MNAAELMTAAQAKEGLRIGAAHVRGERYLSRRADLLHMGVHKEGRSNNPCSSRGSIRLPVIAESSARDGQVENERGSRGVIPPDFCNAGTIFTATSFGVAIAKSAAASARISPIRSSASCLSEVSMFPPTRAELLRLNIVRRSGIREFGWKCVVDRSGWIQQLGEQWLRDSRRWFVQQCVRACARVNARATRRLPSCSRRYGHAINEWRRAAASKRWVASVRSRRGSLFSP
jgi:hypothetical protein